MQLRKKNEQEKSALIISLMVIVSTSPEVAEDLGRIGLKKKIVNELFKKNCHAILVENIKNGQKINYFSSYKKFLKLFL